MSFETGFAYGLLAMVSTIKKTLQLRVIFYEYTQHF